MNRLLISFAVAGCAASLPGQTESGDLPSRPVAEDRGSKILGQAGSSSYDFVEADPFGAPSGQSDAAAELKRLERELADLNAATQQRRAELTRKLAEAQARQAKARAQAEAERFKTRAKLDQWIGGGLAGSVPEPSPVWLIGIAISSAESDDAEGVTVDRVFEGKPAEQAGIRKGDVIVACNGIKPRDGKALTAIISAAGGQELTLRVQRSVVDDPPDSPTIVEELDLEVTPVENEDRKTDSGDRWQNTPFGLPHAWPGYGATAPAAPNMRDPYAMIPPAEYNQLLAVSGDQLAKDNAEIKKLLRELIEEVKKLPKN